MENREINSPKIFRENNALVFRLVRTLISRDFLSKAVRVISRNLHNVNCVKLALLICLEEESGKRIL